MVFKFGFIITTIVLTLFGFVSTVVAGGGGVDTRVSNTEDAHSKTVRVYFDPSIYTCKGMNVSFSFANAEDGDQISNPSIIDDTNYEIVNGKKVLRCSTYAKVYSTTLTDNKL